MLVTQALLDAHARTYKCAYNTTSDFLKVDSFPSEFFWHQFKHAQLVAGDADHASLSACQTVLVICL